MRKPLMVTHPRFGPDVPDVSDLPPGPLLRISQLTRDRLPWLPVGPDGKSFSIPTWHRWTKHGLNGHVLKTIRAGGLKYTTEAWVLRFFQALSDPKAASTAHNRTPARQQQAREAARRMWSAREFDPHAPATGSC